MFRSSLFLPFTVLLALAGCSTTSPLGLSADLLKLAFRPNETVNSASLDERFRYLRVGLNDRFSLFVLAYEERGQADDRGAREIYVSAEREVLTLQGGAIIGFSSRSRQLSAGSNRSIVRPTYGIGPDTLGVARKGLVRAFPSRSGLFNPSGVALEWRQIPGGEKAIQRVSPD